MDKTQQWLNEINQFCLGEFGCESWLSAADIQHAVNDPMYDTALDWFYSELQSGWHGEG